MKIELLLPNGFCYGVITACNKAMEVINLNRDKKIYMLGWIVHNQKVIDDFIKNGVTILNDSQKTRYELISSFDNVTDSILILSAHGTDNNVIELAEQKGFEIVDLTCKYVYKTHNLIKDKIDNNYEIIFIGKNNHPETNAILKNFKNIILIENINDIDKIQFYDDKKYFCTNQTTISQYKFNDVILKLNSLIKNIEFANDICDATKIRQDAVINMNKNVDICIVIGDQKSSNSNELYNIAKNKVESYKVNDINEIDLSWFKNKKYCAITAGASTPKFLIDEIMTYIERNINEN